MPAAALLPASPQPAQPAGAATASIPLLSLPSPSPCVASLVSPLLQSSGPPPSFGECHATSNRALVARAFQPPTTPPPPTPAPKIERGRGIASGAWFAPHSPPPPAPLLVSRASARARDGPHGVPTWRRGDRRKGGRQRRCRT